MFQARFLHVGWLLIAPCAVGLAAQLAGDEASSRLAGSRLASKLAAIEQNGLTEADEPRLTTLTEQEINAYFQFQGRAEMPAGVTDAHIAIEGNGRVLGRAKVDLDQVREQSSGGWLDPLSYLSGSLLILASGVLHTGDGVGRVEIDTVTVAGVSVPTRVPSRGGAPLLADCRGSRRSESRRLVRAALADSRDPGRPGRGGNRTVAVSAQLSARSLGAPSLPAFHGGHRSPFTFSRCSACSP